MNSLEGLTIAFDMNQVPDQVMPIGPGVYTVQVTKVETKAPSKATTQGMNVVLSLKIVNNGPELGRERDHYIFISSKPDQTQEQRARGMTKLKRVLLSCRIPIQANGMNLMVLQGQIGRIKIVSSIYEDNGVKKTGSEIEDWLIPGDPGYDTTPVAVS